MSAFPFILINMKQRNHLRFLAGSTWRWMALALALAGGGGFPARGAAPAVPPAASNLSTNTTGLSLDEVLRLAVDHNPELRASQQRIEAAEGRAWQARLWPNPELELMAEEWPVNGGRGFSDAKQTIGLAQTIPYPGKKKLEGRIGAAGVRLTEAEMSLRRLELIRDVKIAFFQVLAAERLGAVAAELLEMAESSSATAHKRVTAGAAADQEQLRAEISLEQARNELSNYRGELVAARETLAMLVGQPELKETPLDGALAETPNLALLERGPEQWLARHPGLAAAQNSRDRAALELRRARLEPYPDVTVGLAGGRIGESDQSIIQLAISLPLPIVDRSKGRRQEARANAAIAEAEQDSTEQQLLRSWGISRQRFRAALEQASTCRERILPKANQALRLVQMGFEQGKFEFMDLLDVQRTAAEARLAYQKKLLELNIAQAELEALLFPHEAELEPISITP